MARIRSVHPDICRDRDLAKVSAEAERTFVRLWPHLDDEGRVMEDHDLMKADLYPVHANVSVVDLIADLDELVAAGLLLRYEKDGERFLSAKPEPWAKYQKPRHRYLSDLPSPNDADVRPVPADSLQADVGPASADVPPSHVGRASAGGEGLRRGVGGGGVTPEPVPTWRSLVAKSAPPNFIDETGDIVAELCGEFGSGPVDLAVQRLVDDGRAFTLPSKARAALRTLLASTPAEDTTPKCAECGGRFALGSGVQHYVGCSERSKTEVSA